MTWNYFSFVISLALVCLVWSLDGSPVSPDAVSLPNKGVLVVYTFHDTGAAARERLAFFLTFGIQDGVDYVFVINGPSTIAIPSRSNVQVQQSIFPFLV